MLDKINVWKKQLELAKSNRSKEQGRAEALQKRLHTEFGYTNVDDLDAEIAKAKEEITEKKIAFEKAVGGFEHEFANKLAEAAR